MKLLLIPIVIALVVFIATAITFVLPRTLNLANRSNTTISETASVSNLKLGGVLKSFNRGETFDIKVNIPNQDKMILDQPIQNMYFGADNKTLYAITPIGIYYSKSKAESWELAFDATTYPIDSFQFNLNNNDEIYVGTSFGGKARLIKYNIINKNYEELYLEASQGVLINYIFLDKNNTNYIKIILTSGATLVTDNNGLDWRYEGVFPDTIQSIYIDFKNPNNIYFLGGTGLYRSIDAGRNFTLLTPGANPDPRNKRYKFTVYSYAVNPNNNNEIYVGGVSQILRSIDGGATWEPINILTPNSNILIRSIQVHPSNSNIIYYSGASVLYVSTNRGANWTPLELPLNLYVNKILIDSENSDIIYLGTTVPTTKKN